MKDYKDRIKYLISRLYEPADTKDYTIRMTTLDIYKNLCSIIPATSFDEFDLLEVLEELGYQPGYEQKKLEVKNESGKEEERIYDDLTYYWYMKKID
ncbi:MAG: hypothetical protein RBT46_04335 [Weeksellaceae bacterium]|jgi:hypothetical protein|nr:hypothetical protein [Weeksellaceae bacterium]MDX9704920.1 hypothetical protein [Weeksellaceae bacterium]